jgi:hypothetical protein
MLGLHRHQCQHRAGRLLVGLDELLGARHLGDEHVVGPQHEHRLVVESPRGVENRVPLPYGPY